jgi:hypothetical protein
MFHFEHGFHLGTAADSCELKGVLLEVGTEESETDGPTFFGCVANGCDVSGSLRRHD